MGCINNLSERVKSVSAASEKVYAVEMQGISKYFGSFCALNGVQLSVEKGSIHALLGENGAGKSTLMNVLYGLYQADEGEIRINGQKAVIKNPNTAIKLGIGMVHQHFMLVDRLNAVENVGLISNDSPFSILNRQKIRTSLEELKARYGIELDLDCPVEQLSISMQQKIEILKMLYTGADILILDEPTAVLLPQECEALFAIIRHMTQQGKGVIFISHKLDEVLQISGRISVLSHGRVTGETETAGANKDQIVRMMSGDDLPDLTSYVKKPPMAEAVMTCAALEARDDRGVQTLNGVDLTVHRGEIVGVAGVEGNGQNELAEVLAGVRPAASGKISINGQEMSRPAAFIQAGVGYVPADRNAVGTVPDFPLYENWLLRNPHYPKKHGLTDLIAVQTQTTAAMEAFDVRTSGCQERSANLSGGNLQKFILARELENTPQVLICSYPTRGLDVKAAWSVRQQIIRAKEQGTGVVLFSGDLEELFAVSDRIVVLYRGAVIGEVQPEHAVPQDVILLMMGGSV